MKGFHQEAMRVVLLDSQLRCITKVEIAKASCPGAWFHSSFLLSCVFFLISAFSAFLALLKLIWLTGLSLVSKFTSFGLMANTLFVVSPASDCLFSLRGVSPDSGISFPKFQCFSEMRIVSQG